MGDAARRRRNHPYSRLRPAGRAGWLAADRAALATIAVDAAAPRGPFYALAGLAPLGA
jgi:hypothetical protein